LEVGLSGMLLLLVLVLVLVLEREVVEERGCLGLGAGGRTKRFLTYFESSIVHCTLNARYMARY
jgi:hypothetical protein